MKVEQEVYGLKNGEGCENFDAHETEDKKDEKHERKDDSDTKEE